MKKRLLLKVASIVGVVAMMAMCACSGCNSGGRTPSVKVKQDVLPVSQQVLEYFKSTMTEETEFADGYSAYFDFSDGMENAYGGANKTANKTEAQKSLERVSGLVTEDSEWKVYALYSGQVEEQHLDKAKLYKQLCKEKFEEKYAPIEHAVEQIVEENKRALLVTDFEDFTDDRATLKGNPYLKGHFEKWLAKDGVIKFYITSFDEQQSGKQLKKKLFFVVFDSKDLELVTKFEKQIDNVEAYETFVLSNSTCMVQCEYPYGRGGNYHDKTGEDVVLGVVESGDPKYTNYEGLNCEFYPITETWSRVPINVWGVSSGEDSDYEGLFTKIFVDLSPKDSYTIKDVELKVYDVTEDFDLYTNYQAAMRNTPDVSIEEGETVVSFDSHPDACFYYDDTTGELLPEFEYSKKACDEKKVLRINEERLLKGKNDNPEKTPIIIDLDEPYLNNALYQKDPKTGKTILNDQVLSDRIAELDDKMIRIDICLGKSEIDKTKLGDLFLFESLDKGSVTTNDCIEQSVEMMMKQLNSEGKVIYSIFVQNQ